MNDVTVLLHKLAEDDPAAMGQLFELLYPDLHRMAHARLARSGSFTLLNTTGLAHEAFLRLQQTDRIDVDSRGQFMAYVSKVLRAVIVDFARKRSAEKRGGGNVHVTLNTGIADAACSPGDDIEHINDALIELEKSDPRLKQVVEMRFFGGLTEKEIGEILGISDRTVRSDWERARLLLSVELKR